MNRRAFLAGLGAAAGALILPYEPKRIYSFGSEVGIVRPFEFFFRYDPIPSPVWVAGVQRGGSVAEFAVFRGEPTKEKVVELEEYFLSQFGISDPAETEPGTAPRYLYPEELTADERAQTERILDVDVDAYLRWLAGEGPDPCPPESSGCTVIHDE